MNNFYYDLTLPSPNGEGFMELFINSIHRVFSPL
jgi:hypothetical protein